MENYSLAINVIISQTIYTLPQNQAIIFMFLNFYCIKFDSDYFVFVTVFITQFEKYSCSSFFSNETWKYIHSVFKKGLIYSSKQGKKLGFTVKKRKFPQRKSNEICTLNSLQIIMQQISKLKRQRSLTTKPFNFFFLKVNN